MSTIDINYSLPTSQGRRVMLVFAILGLVITLMMQSYIWGVLSSISMVRFLLLQFSWNVEMFNTNLVALGYGINAYSAQLWYNLLYPVAYSTFLFCTLFLLLTPKPRGFNLLAAYRRAWALERFRRLRATRGFAVFPIIAGIADLVQNCASIALLQGAAVRTDALVLVAFVAVLTKWLFVVLTVWVGVYAFVVQWLAKHRRRA